MHYILCLQTTIRTEVRKSGKISAQKNTENEKLGATKAQVEAPFREGLCPCEKTALIKPEKEVSSACS